jgi:hypothetical protein
VLNATTKEEAMTIPQTIVVTTFETGGVKTTATFVPG